MVEVERRRPRCGILLLVTKPHPRSVPVLGPLVAAAVAHATANVDCGAEDNQSHQAKDDGDEEDS